jgi:hypothetical protein
VERVSTAAVAVEEVQHFVEEQQHRCFSRLKDSRDVVYAALKQMAEADPLDGVDLKLESK